MAWDQTSNGGGSVTFGTSGGTAAEGNDSRITGAAQKASNLSDLASKPAARTALGFLANGITDVLTWTHGYGSSSARTINASTFTVTGTLSVVYGTYRRYQKMLSAAASLGTQNGYAATSTNAITTDLDATVYVAFRMDSDLSNLRTWVGFGASFTNSDTIGANSFGIRYTNGTDTNWMLTARAAGAQATPVDTGVVVTANDELIAEFKHNKAGGTIAVRISKDDGATWSSAVSVSTVPVTGTNLGPTVAGWNIAGTRATSTLWSTVVARQYLEQA